MSLIADRQRVSFTRDRHEPSEAERRAYPMIRRAVRRLALALEPLEDCDQLRPPLEAVRRSEHRHRAMSRLLERWGYDAVLYRGRVFISNRADLGPACDATCLTFDVHGLLILR